MSIETLNVKWAGVEEWFQENLCSTTVRVEFDGGRWLGWQLHAGKYRLCYTSAERNEYQAVRPASVEVRVTAAAGLAALLAAARPHLAAQAAAVKKAIDQIDEAFEPFRDHT